MLKKLFVVFFIFFLSINLAQSMEINGTTLPNFIKLTNGKLLLRGTGVLKFYGMIDVYSAGLYLPKENKNLQSIIENDEPMAVRLSIITRGYTKNQWVAAWEDGFKKIIDKSTDISQQINSFNEYFKEDSNKNDFYEFIYLPGQGTSISKNNKVIGVVQGFQFKKALFSIWLGNQPDDKNVKIKILNKLPAEDKLEATTTKEEASKEEPKTHDKQATPLTLKARLFIKTTPANADIRLPEVKQKFTQGIELNKGKYQVKISAHGYEETKISIALNSGEEKRQEITLKKFPEQKPIAKVNPTPIKQENKKDVSIPAKTEKVTVPKASLPPIQATVAFPAVTKPEPQKSEPIAKQESPKKETPPQPPKSEPVAAAAQTPNENGYLEIGGIQLPNIFKVGNNKLILNGAGIRRKFGIKIYAGGLYLKQIQKDGEKIYPADELMATRLHLICRGLTGSQWASGWLESFKKAAGDNIAAIQDKVDNYISFFQDGSKENDYYDIVYNPSKGVSVSKNGTILGTIKGFDFKKILFSIWTGENPGDTSLKKGMLGAG